ncbi:heterokaryon incompatibility protein-domain-containing protein [Thelonectria olida]|uniref:Heterokaryon incompatibility protein-domain-containing protein n=1 Tax=Thelonectria olida TaxID=1576542 RepID=A0A9P9AJR5_9HYPO|nr:heterokaryon incompatibility protein-domain-containing protein [Thelonectria olida]
MESTDLVAARQYPGCFTSNEVRQLLGQAWTDENSSADDERPGRDAHKVTLENHWRPDCICAPLHAQCLAPDSPPHATDETPSSTSSSSDDSDDSDSSDSSDNVNITITLDQLRELSRSACWFCSVIYAGIEAMPPWDPILPIPSRTSFRLESSESGICVTALNETKGYLGPVPEPKVMLYVDGNRASTTPCKLLHARQETIYSDPHQQMQFLSRVLQKCLDNHQCAPEENSFMPTRLVHVQVIDGQYATRLVTDVSLGPYVTLSHCWGRSFPSYAKTTESNIQSRCSPLGIAWEELPQTFRDAVAVTERLGFEYIWIDALCIIQDSPSDWEAESRLMSEVYSYCALMLSSDASSDTNVGFFRSANMSTKPWPALGSNSAVRASFSLTHRVYGLMPPMYIPFEQSHIYPLSTRAWCYQEGRLARRVVHFSVDEVSYDCVDGVECQCGSWGPEGYKYGTNSWHKTLPHTTCTAEEKHSLWLYTVTMYSERDLSFPTDRFPALSALARQFHFSGSTKSESSPAETPRKFTDIDLGVYMAGFWSNFLLGDLFWYVDYRPGARISTTSSYVAPTWSWASVSGGINWGKPGTLCVELISVHCDSSGSDDLGKMTYGELVLKARIVPVRLTRTFYNLGQKKEWNIGLECQDPETGEQACLGAYRPDCIEPVPGTEFFGGIIPSLWHSDYSPDKAIPVEGGEYFAMLLGETAVIIMKAVQDGDPREYERAGTVHGNATTESEVMTGWFDGVEPQVLKVI